MSAMARLYRKDWRVYRSALLGGVALLVVPYALAALELLAFSRGAGAQSVSIALRGAAFLGLFLTVVTAAVFGGAAFAAERRDRSAEFLALVPVSRLRVARSKLRAPLTFLAAAWAVHAFFVVLAGVYDGRALDVLLNTASAAAMVFGVAWLASSAATSPAIAATLGVALTTFALVVTIDLARPPDEAYSLMGVMEFVEGSARIGATAVGPVSVQVIARAVLWVLGIGAWVAGTAVFVRRVEP